MTIATLGIDLAKNVFQLHGVDNRDKPVLNKRLKRNQLLSFLTNLPPCLIGLEACGSSNYWARQFQSLGHEVRLISPQYVKPYVKTNKNDFNDAVAICEAVLRPGMHFVPVKTIEQQDIQVLHRVRERLVQNRTAVVNQIRGILREYGVFMPVGITRVRAQLHEVLEDADNELTPMTRQLLAEQATFLRELDCRVGDCDRRIQSIFCSGSMFKRLADVEGVGPMTATALVAAVGDANTFRNGRHLSAWLGLVPRQCSSGDRQRLLSISKRGNVYLRMLLIHGARSVLQRCESRTDARGRWMQALKKRRGFNRACVALANKNARVLWALMTHEEDMYRQTA